MNRFLAAAALALIAGSALYYNVRVRASARPPTSPGATPPGLRDISAPTSEEQPHAIDLNERTISAVGAIRATKQVVISARIPSRIGAVLVMSGASVRAGQPLVKLDAQDSAAQISVADAAVDAARAQEMKAIEGERARSVELDSQISQADGGLRAALVKLRQAELALPLTESSTRSDADRAKGAVRQAEAGLNQAEAGSRQAEDGLKRSRFLYSHGGVARVDLEGAESQAEIAKAQRDSALAVLDQARSALKPAESTAPLRQQVTESDLQAAQSGVRQAREGVQSAHKSRVAAIRVAELDIAAARAGVKQAEASRRQASVQVGNSVLASPFDGIAADVSARAGEAAQPGQPLLTVFSPSSLVIEAAVPSRFAVALRAGQPAEVRLDRDPGRSLHGHVSEILPLSADGRSITVRVKMDSYIARPAVNETGRVDIRLSR